MLHWVKFYRLLLIYILDSVLLKVYFEAIQSKSLYIYKTIL